VYEKHLMAAGANARKEIEKLPANEPLIKAYGDMSDEELGLIRLYTFSYYDEFNKYLRGREIKDLEPGEEDFISKATASMKESLGKLPDSTNPEFYRGMALDPRTSRSLEAYSGLEAGDTIADKGFCSFTSDRGIADDFMVPGGGRQNVLLVNKSKKLKNIAPVSGSKSEAEHLAMPGTAFRVRSNSITDHSMFGKVRVIELDDKGK